MQRQDTRDFQWSLRNAGRRNRRASWVLDHRPRGFWELPGRNAGVAVVTINVPEMQLMGAVPTRPFMQTVKATSGQYT